MAKGKNHDRKANPGFGKVKSSAQKGEFNMKRVKGGSSLISVQFRVVFLVKSDMLSRRELLPRCQVGIASQDVEWW